MTKAIVLAEALEKQYGSKQAVRGISFEINRGDIYGFIGRNGAGKTTVMRMLCGLMRPSKGRIQVLGESDGRGPQIGYLPQNIRFDDHRTVGDTLRFFGQLRSVPAQQVAEVIQGLELEEHQRARNLSPGQQRQLQMAVATLGNPELLVFDEPTAGLDPSAVQQVRQTIRRLNSQGCTVFISSHVLQELDTLCDKVAVIDEGRLLYQGPCASTYELEVAGDPRAVCCGLDAPFAGRCTPGLGTLQASVERDEVPALLSALHQRGVAVYGVKRMGLELFYNGLMKEGA